MFDVLFGTRFCGPLSSSEAADDPAQNDTYGKDHEHHKSSIDGDRPGEKGNLDHFDILENKHDDQNPDNETENDS